MVGESCVCDVGHELRRLVAIGAGRVYAQDDAEPNAAQRGGVGLVTCVFVS
jgi:hypothetical protein